MKARKPLEKTIVKSALSFLNSLPKCHAFKTHGGMYGNNGISDIVCSYQGKAIFLECKRSEKEKPTGLQQKFLDDMKATGAITDVVWDLEQVKKIIWRIDLSANYLQ